MQDINTLITGESGTGKELVARAITFSQYIPFDPATLRFQVQLSAEFSPDSPVGHAEDDAGIRIVRPPQGGVHRRLQRPARPPGDLARRTTVFFSMKSARSMRKCK
ncbi:MAG: sigma 54-interacting transcriptional regulator [Victivallis sp.]